MRFILVVLSACSFGFSWFVQTKGAQPVAPCLIRELLNPNGWDIPGLSKAVVKTHGHYTSQGVPENVFVDGMEPTVPEATLMFVGLKSCEVAQLNLRSIDVTKVERFTMNGRIFGYRILGTIATLDEHGRRIHFGSQESVYYYDPDGSGKFSVMHYDTGELIFKIIVPDWVNQKAR